MVGWGGGFIPIIKSSTNSSWGWVGLWQYYKHSTSKHVLWAFHHYSNISKSTATTANFDCLSNLIKSFLLIWLWRTNIVFCEILYISKVWGGKSILVYICLDWKDSLWVVSMQLFERWTDPYYFYVTKETLALYWTF